jgi:2-polyprenyl-3-methyl-5-hydroxy-6-metoxy-1,4-benzoquinol methylase
MKTSLIPLLRCPVSGQPLHVHDLHGEPTPSSALEIEEGWLISEDGKNRHPVRGGIPRFVPESNYADNFGMQWNKFSRTQLDSHSGHPITAERFWAATGWKPEDLKGRWLLDVGCGSGRFAEVALSAGANVVALDYSSAVDAAAANLGQHERLHIVQGDIYALPFAQASFDAVYSLGVLQHTPDVEQAFMALPRMIRAGGALVVDFYGKSWKSALLPKYWLRPITKRLPKTALFRLLEMVVPVMLPVSNLLAEIPVLGHLLRRLVPVANYTGRLPLSRQQIREWALLDTFDWLSPTYDHPQTPETVNRWLHAANLQQVEVLHAGHLVGRGRRS